MHRSRLVIPAAIVLMAAGAVAGGVAAFVPGSHGGPVVARAAGDAGDDDDVPPPYLNVTGQPSSGVQLARARQQAAGVPAGDSAAWQFVGPTNIGGRVTDLAMDPTTSPSTVYAAVSSGGIMKSADGGTTWSPSWPSSNTQAMGALARGPDGTLWAGTGEANPSGGGGHVPG